MRKDIIKVRKVIDHIVDTGSKVDMETLGDIMEKAIIDGCHSLKLQMEIYSLAYGPHFNENTLHEALAMIGGVKLKCDEIESMLRSYGLTYSPELTIYDISYAIHMMYSDYHHLNLPDQTIFRLAVAYCEDEDYPVKYGKCFVEWFNKISLIKH